MNDNLYKNALVVLALFSAAQAGPILVAAAGGLFILPYVLFSATAGQLADRFDKASLIRIVKAAEVAIMAAAAAGFMLGSIPLLMAVLFGLGIQATFFSPLKYGILPDHLAERELVAGNGLIEAGTFLGILVGTIAGGALIALPSGTTIVSVLGPPRRGGRVRRRVPRAAGAARGAGTSHRLECRARHARPAEDRQGKPPGLAVHLGLELVLDRRRHAAVGVPGRRETGSRGRQPGRDLSPDRVRHRRRHGIGRHRPDSEGRGHRAPCAVRGVRHLAVHLGLRNDLHGSPYRPADRHGPAVVRARLADERGPVPLGRVRRHLLGAAIRHRPRTSRTRRCVRA